MSITDGKPAPIFFVANTSWYLWNFRKETIRALVAEGYVVVCVCPDWKWRAQLEGLGAELRCRVLGKNPLLKSAVWLFYAVHVVMASRPKVIFSFTTSANFLFLFIGNILKIPVIPNISGTGRLAKGVPPFRNVFLRVYAFISSKGRFVIFQNVEDKKRFVSLRKAILTKCTVVHGSGVDLEVFKYARLSRGRRAVTITFMSRLMPEKGLRDLVHAVLLLPKDDFRLVIAGAIDRQRRNTITDAELQKWTAEENITYLGSVEQVLPILQDSDLVALPSYYGEGVPKILIEGCAIGRPILTTDTPGCRVTASNDNGYIVEPRSPKELANALQDFFKLDIAERDAKSHKSRALAERLFDVEINIRLYRSIVDEVLQQAG